MLMVFMFEGSTDCLSDENERGLIDETDRIYISTWYNKDVMNGITTTTIRNSLLLVCYFYRGHCS